MALALVAGTVAVLFATSGMGFTRDESFYFKYATTYQDWFARVAADERQADEDPEAAAARDPRDLALGRDDVIATWQQNFEHPPLMKVLFGVSWRLLADKQRPIRDFRADPEVDGAVIARVTRLAPADGFRKGDEVQLLGPHPIGTDRSAESRHLGWATVIERTDREARLRVSNGDLETLEAACKEPRESPPTRIAGCQASSSGAFQVLSESSALRFPAWLFTGLLIALLYLFGTELFGRWAGLFAALSFLCLPRQFFHAHLCCFDIPVTTMIVATVYAFWRSLRSRWWVGVVSVTWGLGLLTKLNAFFIPIPLVAAWLLTPALRAARRPRMADLPSRRSALRWGTLFAATAATWLSVGAVLGLCVALLGASLLGARLRLPDLPRAFLWMPPVGLTIMFVLWPRMWYDPADAFYHYVNFHVGHVHYLQQYFGTILTNPPFPVTYPWVMTALTVPVALMAVFLIGCVTLYGTERKANDLFVRVLLAANLLFPIALISLPSTPIFGGVKHWLAAMAFGALIAGYGFDWLRCKACAALPRWRPIRAVATAALLALVLSSGVVASLRHVEYGTSYYNELTGGVRGAADNRMQRQFWGYAGRLALDHINRNAPRGSTVAFHNSTWDAHEFYKRDGLLRDDIRWRRDPPGNGCRHGAAYYLFHHQESFAQDHIDSWEAMGTFAPERVFDIDGVPVLSVYRCAENRRATERRPGTTGPAIERMRPRRGPGTPPGARTPPPAD